MATASTISPVSRKLAMNPVLPFDTRNNNNLLIADENNKAVSGPTSRNEQHRVLVPNTNRPTYGPLIPPAKTNARDSLSSVTPCYTSPQHMKSMPTVNRRDVRPSPPEKPRSNLSALLAAQSESRTPQPTSAIHMNCATESAENRSRDNTDPAIGALSIERKVDGFSSSVMDNSLQTCTTPPTGIPAVAPPISGPENTVEGQSIPNNGDFVRINSRRCLSSKDISGLVPALSGSPYAFMLYQKEAIESRMTERLNQTRQGTIQHANPSLLTFPDDSSSSSRGAGFSRLANEARNRRRAEHNRAVRNDLCDIVADLFIAESKLLNPSKYGVDTRNVLRRDEVLESVARFIKALPPRYALSAETPSEVLLHMRLMQAVRLDHSRPTVHIAKLENDRYWSNATSSTAGPGRSLMLVTIACADAVGLLEYISKVLASGSSRVLDADVMLSTDNIVLDRFVVEMNGRLRLDKLATYIQKFLEKSRKKQIDKLSGATGERSFSAESTSGGSDCSSSKVELSGSLYYQPTKADLRATKAVEDEIKSALPLSVLVAGQGGNDQINMLDADCKFQPLCRNLSLPPNFRSTAHSVSKAVETISTVQKASVDSETGRGEPTSDHTPKPVAQDSRGKPKRSGNSQKRRPLVNRQGNSDLDTVDQDHEDNDNALSIEYVTLDGAGTEIDCRQVPLIPFDELMLIETLGMGRVSTIYRAAWSTSGLDPHTDISQTAMLALKVAMVNQKTLDTSHVDELRREADIAARLDHLNICSLVGVAADAECFCLAYEFCEGGSLLSLLSDSTRYYEYLPIALDVANGMAYLHSRNVIHRDLKPSNILLTRDNRAKIADFGMSVTHTGQELTAETGTYRYMAPEVIRHESYSSNADVYSFGICLWQLISREVPFATMTPIQAAYAVAEGRRPPMPESTPRQLRDIITACWDQDSRKRPSFTFIAMALADYAKMAFSPAAIGAQTLNIANQMLASVEGNSTVNVDFSAPVLMGTNMFSQEPEGSNIGLEI